MLREERRNVGRIYFVEVDGHEVGVLGHECEKLEEVVE